MSSLYKRIITLGMISASALLAWIYCITVYKDKPLYIVIVSIILILTVYALLHAIIGLRMEKDKELQDYIQDTANDVVKQAIEAGNNSDDMERLSKASYVQLRKTNTQLSETTTVVADSINKATKIIVKYNENNNQKLLEALENLSANLPEQPAYPDYPNYQETLDRIRTEITELQQTIKDRPVTVVAPANENSASSSVISETSSNEYNMSKADEDTSQTRNANVLEVAATTETAEFDNNDSANTVEFNDNASAETVEFYDNESAKTVGFDDNESAKTADFDDEAPNLDDFFNQFGGDIEEDNSNKEPLADVIPFPSDAVSNNTSLDEDNSDIFDIALEDVPDEINTYDNSDEMNTFDNADDNSDEVNTFDATDDSTDEMNTFDNADDNSDEVNTFDATDDSTDEINTFDSSDEINALNNVDTENNSDETTTISAEEEDATPPPDPNRPLSPEEIAALFASMGN